MVSRFVIVTGMSGAGKSVALKMLEDAGYFCVDNLPANMLKSFIVMLLSSDNEDHELIALGMDVRSGSVRDLLPGVGELKKNNIRYEILFLDAADSVLLARYKESRRTHPLSGRGGKLITGIEEERRRIDPLKKHADYILDTSHLLTRDLRQMLDRIFVADSDFKNLVVNIISFGFKNGIPADADIVMDARFLPNPYYVEELKKLSGNDREVRDYVMSSELAQTYVAQLTAMLNYLLPHYVEEGKNQLVVAIGCTGGRHRSVTIANELYGHLMENKNYGLKLEHRDMDRDARIKELQ